MANCKKDKRTKKRKLKKLELNTSSDQKENRPKCKTITIADLSDRIAMSKQLILNKVKTLQNRRAKRHDETRVCGNGIPLPSLAELEKMYEDSDEEISSVSTPQENTTTSESPQEEEPQVTENKLLSPTTINKISERFMNIISDISDPTELLNEVGPPPPVIPQKKRKKPEEPYIVGCKDRPKLVSKPNTNFCKGDEEYGVDPSNAEPDSPPRKRAKKSKIPSYSKSRFNARSDEIAEQLTKYDGNTEETNYDSADSNKTVEYDPTKIISPKQPSFSPLPSTSRDSETFIRNDELFNESLREDTIVERPIRVKAKNNEKLKIIATIVIDEDEDVEIIQTPPKLKSNNKKPEDDISCIENPTENNKQNNITDHDEYIGLLEMNDENIDNTDFEVDIDTVIAQNQAILGKFKRKNILNATVTTAETSTSTDNLNTQSEDIVNNENGNTELNKIRTTSDETTLNVDQNILPNPRVMPEATITSSLNSVRLNPPTADHQRVMPRATTPSSLNSIRLNRPTADHLHVMPRATTTSSLNSVRLNPPTADHQHVMPRATTTSSLNSSALNPTTAHQLYGMPSGTIPENPNSVRLNPPQVHQHGLPRIPSNPSVSLNQPTAHHHIGRPKATIPSRSRTNSVSLNAPTLSCPHVGQQEPFLRIRTTGPSLDTATHIYSSLPSTSRSGPLIEKVMSDFFKSNPTIAAPPVEDSCSPDVRCANRMRNTINQIFKNITCLWASKLTTSLQKDYEKKKSVSNPSHVESRNVGECPICMDEMTSTNGIASTKCGHVFCLRCIKVAIQTNGKRCPTCRKSLRGSSGYHQLYL